MAYPKPLSEKNLAKMYTQANIDERKSDFLHKFFLACSNLYGDIALRDMWEILKKCAPQYDMTDIKRKDLIEFSSIVRREKQPYYVFETDELYWGENRSDLKREIVNEELLAPAGFDRLSWIWKLDELRDDTPLYIPNDILSFANPTLSKEEKALLDFLGNLEVNAEEAQNSYGMKFKCRHYGEKLKDFSFRNDGEEREFRYCEKDSEKRSAQREQLYRELIKRTTVPENEKIVARFKQDCSLGFQNLSKNMQWVCNELAELCVLLNEKQNDELFDLMVEFNNRCHMWVIYGWTPHELAEYYRKSTKPSNGPTTLQFGDGFKKAVADGLINLEELEKEMKKRGIKLEF